MPNGPAVGRGERDNFVYRQELGGEANRAGVREAPEQSDVGLGKGNQETISKVTEECGAREEPSAQTRSPALGYRQAAPAGYSPAKRKTARLKLGPDWRMRCSPSSALGFLPSFPTGLGRRRRRSDVRALGQLLWQTELERRGGGGVWRPR